MKFKAVSINTDDEDFYNYPYTIKEFLKTIGIKCPIHVNYCLLNSRQCAREEISKKGWLNICLVPHYYEPKKTTKGDTTFKSSTWFDRRFIKYRKKVMVGFISDEGIVIPKFCLKRKIHPIPIILHELLHLHPKRHNKQNTHCKEKWCLGYGHARNIMICDDCDKIFKEVVKNNFEVGV